AGKRRTGRMARRAKPVYTPLPSSKCEVRRVKLEVEDVMRRVMFIRSTLGLTCVLAIVCGAFVFAQQPAQAPGAARQGGRGGAAAPAGGGGQGAARAAVAPAFLKVEWGQPQGQAGRVPVVLPHGTDRDVG